jgi:hypothetical protein
MWARKLVASVAILMAAPWSLAVAAGSPSRIRERGREGHANLALAAAALNNARIASAMHEEHTLSNAAAGWHTIASNDFNGDGKSNILWQNRNGIHRGRNAERGREITDSSERGAGDTGAGWSAARIFSPGRSIGRSIVLGLTSWMHMVQERAGAGQTPKCPRLSLRHSSRLRCDGCGTAAACFA